MGLTQIKQAVRRLSLAEIRRLDEWLHKITLKAEEAAQAERNRPRRQVVEERTVENSTYRLEGVRCGKDKCKCAEGKLHGPYWYCYMRVEGRVKSKYVGKKLPAAVEKRLRLRNKT